MATRALDVVTIIHALSRLDSELKTTNWLTKNAEQQQLFSWLDQYRDSLSKITGLDALASRYYEELNNFLVSRRFKPMFDEFDPDEGLGVVSVLDKMVRWKNGPGAKVEIQTKEGVRPGFEITPAGVNIYQVEGFSNSHLLELLTNSDDTLWLFVQENYSLEGLDLVKLSFEVMDWSRYYPKAELYAGAKIPMVDFDVSPDIGWLKEAIAITEDNDTYKIEQAKQQYKLRMDETGARVKVATGIGVMRSTFRPQPQIFVVDRPFYGWWTQKGVNLPMAAFFADWDSMKQPEGSLEDL